MLNGMYIRNNDDDLKVQGHKNHCEGTEQTSIWLSRMD